MNRTFALLLALLALVAHMLAIHKDATDAFAPPYEVAHVAYRLARNWVHSGACVWDPTGANVESYPSLAWLAVCWIPERMYWAVTTFTQSFSAVCALLTALLLARFSTGRLAGVIAPLLFVASGSVASAAASGTEMTLLALLVTGAFLAYERGSRVLLGLLLALCCVTRAEGTLYAWCLLTVELGRRLHARRNAGPYRSMLPAFLAPALVALIIALVRNSITGHFLSPWSKFLTHPERLPWESAFLYLRDFFVSSGSAMLLVFPLWYALRGHLTGLGVRALCLTLAWCAIATLGGGGPQPLPFSVFMVPILATLFIAVQEAMTVALDSQRTFLPPLTWALFGLGMASSAMASKYPGDLGPLPTANWHRAWMQPHTTPRFGYESQLGRVGLEEEIENTQRLRSMGVFLREHLDPTHSVLTPWPGAIGYLSRLRVIDALSRVTPIPGVNRTHGWSAVERCDVIAALDQKADYIVPTLGGGKNAPVAQEIVLSWIQNLDYAPKDGERRARIFRQLSEYELITVPAATASARPPTPGDRYYLLRRRDLELAPKLEVARDGDDFVVSVRHQAHDQLVDLRIQIEDARGDLWSLTPTGEFQRRPHLTARRSVLLFPTGTRSIELMRATIPPELEAVNLLALLRNPGARGSLGVDAACKEIIVPLR